MEHLAWYNDVCLLAMQLSRPMQLVGRLSGLWYIIVDVRNIHAGHHSLVHHPGFLGHNTPLATCLMAARNPCKLSLCWFLVQILAGPEVWHAYVCPVVHA